MNFKPIQKENDVFKKAREIESLISELSSKGFKLTKANSKSLVMKKGFDKVAK
ncbi:hypothetical protein [Campylobacter volucris]|uniref:hypothetical protein n=1 Tax=Campylobacter volucris TaxID=1031542 RepID=UPI000581D179|nr:hypothetical protein [Campylobacter volucris]AJC94130.1 hypothetical protein CVOL_0823 [Campylobacter volucris LMG 24379]QEL08345.1 hypothetical protein CVOLT_0829 [Campylobacter volucris]HEC1753574.1 hypothetical protein [Campylobacter lari]